MSNVKKPIYSITCYYLNEDKFKNNKYHYKSLEKDRRWAFYHEPERAFKCVKENWTDMYEQGYYNYVKVTEERPGFDFDKKEWWFKVLVSNKGGFQKVEFVGNFFEKEESFGVQESLPESFNSDI